MNIKPKVARDTPISVKAQGIKVRYDPAEHADGVQVPENIGRALVKSGHWVEVAPKRASQMLRVPKETELPPTKPVFKDAMDGSDDSIQS